MNKVDEIYKELILDIHKNGVWDKDDKVRTKYIDGIPAYTKSVIGKQIVFESEDIPIITTKYVAWRSAVAEAWWIWFMRSNNVEELRQLGSKVWDEWELDDGSIGTAYGHVLKKPVRNYTVNHNFNVMLNQVDYLLEQLKDNPSSRRHIVSLWSPEDLDTGALEPCVWSSQWIVQEGKLNLIVNQRSADIALGVCFNWIQYKVIQMIVAKLTDLKVGKMIWNFGHLHYYDRHEKQLLEQIEGKQFDQPQIHIADRTILEYFIYATNPTKEDLREMIKIENYTHGGKFDYEVAI